MLNKLFKYNNISNYGNYMFYYNPISGKLLYPFKYSRLPRYGRYTFLYNPQDKMLVENNLIKTNRVYKRESILDDIFNVLDISTINILTEETETQSFRDISSKQEILTLKEEISKENANTNNFNIDVEMSEVIGYRNNNIISKIDIPTIFCNRVDSYLTSISQDEILKNILRQKTNISKQLYLNKEKLEIIEQETSMGNIKEKNIAIEKDFTIHKPRKKINVESPYLFKDTAKNIIIEKDNDGKKQKLEIDLEDDFILENTRRKTKVNEDNVFNNMKKQDKKLNSNDIFSLSEPQQRKVSEQEDYIGSKTSFNISVNEDIVTNKDNQKANVLEDITSKKDTKKIKAEEDLLSNKNIKNVNIESEMLVEKDYKQSTIDKDIKTKKDTKKILEEKISSLEKDVATITEEEYERLKLHKRFWFLDNVGKMDIKILPNVDFQYPVNINLFEESQNFSEFLYKYTDDYNIIEGKYIVKLYKTSLQGFANVGEHTIDNLDLEYENTLNSIFIKTQIETVVSEDYPNRMSIEIKINNIDFDYMVIQQPKGFMGSEFVFVASEKFLSENHPIPIGEDLGLFEIPVPIPIMVDFINILLMIWSKFYHSYSGCIGTRAIESFIGIVYEWLTLETSTQVESIESYNRCYRWLRWECEKVYNRAKLDPNLHGNRWIEEVIFEMIDYMDMHHFDNMPEWDDIERMDEQRNGIFQDQNLDIEIVIEKFKGIRKRVANKNKRFRDF